MKRHNEDILVPDVVRKEPEAGRSGKREKGGPRMARVELLLTATSVVCWLGICVLPLVRLTRRGLYVPRDFFGWYALCASLLAFVFVAGAGLWVSWAMSAAGALLTGRLTGWMRA